MKRLLPLALAAIVIVGGVVFWQFSGASAPGSTAIDLPGSAQAQSAEDVDTSGIVEMSLGDPNAPITMIEYASYTCPHCASFHAGAFKDLKKDYIDTGKVHFIYREVYFDRYGLWASMVARCGGGDKFFGISDLLYSTQSEWARGGDPVSIADNLRRIGLTAGIEQETLDACLADGEKAQALVGWYQANAAADEVTSTPSFVINGEKYSNMSYSAFQEVLDNL